MDAIGHMKQSLNYKIFATEEAFNCVIIFFLFFQCWGLSLGHGGCTLPLSSSP